MSLRRRLPAPLASAAAATAILVAAAGAGGATAAGAPEVVVSIKPIHSLVAGVMAGVGEPGLILRGGASPHTYQMRPSEARMLDGADVVFYVGEALETFLAKPLRSLGGDARVVALMEAEGIELLPYRQNGPLEGHGHHGGRAGRTAGAGNHDHEREAAAEHDYDEHDHAGMDAHIWLDPANARAIVRAVAAELAAVNPDHRESYRENARRVVARLNALDGELHTLLEPVKGVPFVVFHDAYQYLERRYGLSAVGAITLGPERRPGAHHLREVRARIRELDARCVFSEPQFEPKLVATAIEGTNARAGVLDPEGGAREVGPDAYFELMRANAAALVSCLGRQS